MIMISSNFMFNFTNFCVLVSFLTKLLTLGITRAVRAVAVAKLVLLGISPLTSFILALRVEVVAKLAIVDILPLNSFILALRVVLLT